VHHVIVCVDPSADRSWIPEGAAAAAAASAASGPPHYGAPVPTDGVHAKDRILGAPGAALSAEEWSEGVKRLKPRMLVSLVDSLAMDQCLVFCRTNVDCDNLEAYLMVSGVWERCRRYWEGLVLAPLCRFNGVRAQLMKPSYFARRSTCPPPSPPPPQAIGGGAKFRPGMEKGKENKYSCCVLAGMRGQDERRRNLEAFRDGDVRFLICTDVGARGIDIKELPYVVNMTLPDEPENYIHRIGRVGRADRVGLAVSLVATARERVWFHKCANRGKGCADVKGCTVWYDEPRVLAAVHRRLGLAADADGGPGAAGGIPAMLCERDAATPAGKAVPYLFALPPAVAALGAVYGEEMEGGGGGGGRGAGDAGTALHVAAIRTAVESLASMEVVAQSAYLSMKTTAWGV